MPGEGPRREEARDRLLKLRLVVGGVVSVIEFQLERDAHLLELRIRHVQRGEAARALLQESLDIGEKAEARIGLERIDLLLRL